jgi:rSAM/selenodomain-associated transferase 2
LRLNPRITVIVPVLNEAGGRLVEVLFRASTADQLIVVDGGSSDTTRHIAQSCGATVISAPQGRASQMNVGASLANGEWLLFLHGDVLLPLDWRQRMVSVLNEHQRRSWGRFDVRFTVSNQTSFIERIGLSCIAWFMNTRSRLTGISTGDQTQFFERAAFTSLGGFPTQLLMEDIEVSKRARNQIGWPINLPLRAEVSPRRWQDKGYVRTIFLMWKLRWRYWRGASAESLYAIYYQKTP